MESGRNTILSGADSGTQTGWAYTQDGTPVAFIQPLDAPGKATVIAFSAWFHALRYAYTYALEMGCDYLGGPDSCPSASLDKRGDK